MAVNCSDPGAVANAAYCFECNIPPGGQLAVQTYLLAQIAFEAGAITTTDPSDLLKLASAAGFLQLNGTELAVQDYLLCLIANAAGA